MAVLGTLLGEKAEGRGGIRSSGGIPVLDEVYTYLVEMADVTADRIDVLAVAGVPRVGITVSPLGIGVCQSVECVRREDQRKLWDIVAIFSSEVQEQQQFATPDDTVPVTVSPEEWVPIYETKFERLQEVSTKDVNGVAIANSAGQPFENGIMRAKFVAVWEFFQIEPATLSDSTVASRNEVVNSVAFKGKAPKTLLCTVLSSTVGLYYGSKRRLTKYALRVNPDKWTQKRLDVGTVYLDGAQHVPYTDNDGNIMLGGLNGSGGKVTPGAPPALLEFDVYPSIAFASFLK